MSVQPESLKGAEIMRLSYSIAKILLNKSAAHAHLAHRLGGGVRKKATGAMDAGKIFENLITGENLDKIVEVDAKDWKGGAAKTARAEAEANGKVAVLSHQYEVMVEGAKVLRDRLEAHLIKFSGEHQVRIEWESDGVPCSAVLDHLILRENSALILDLKTTDSVAPWGITKKFLDMGYEIQYTAYIEAVETLYPHLAGKVKMVFPFCEREAPNEVAIIGCAGSMRELGKRRWARAKRMWGECLKTGEFPGYMTGDIIEVEALPWQLTIEEQQSGEDYDD